MYLKAVPSFFVATNKKDASDKQKTGLLQAVGGVDMIELVEETGKVILVALAADEDTCREAVAADTFDQAAWKIRQVIVSKTNQAMFQQMEQGSHKFEGWAREIFKQECFDCKKTGYFKGAAVCLGVKPEAGVKTKAAQEEVERRRYTVDTILDHENHVMRRRVSW